MQHKKLIAAIGLVLIAGMVFSINPVFAGTGRGTIQKNVYYDGVPLQGAYVELWQGIYFLDEPETALSPKSQVELLQILTRAMTSGNTQFIIATHSPILLACPGATIYSFDHIPIEKIDYQQTDYYRVYKDFMNNPQKYIG